jgi:hypothetical protein
MKMDRYMISGMVVLLSFGASAITLNESPAEAGAWGFRPAEGAAAAQNPPAFTWRPEKKAASYHLQVAADPAFENMVCAAEKTPWSAHCPAETFPAGSYYWRYAAADEAGARSAWSRVRHFEVPADVPVFPKPAMADLAERIPASHPRLFFRPEDVPRLRELAEGPLAQEWAAIVKSADHILGNPPDTTEPPKYPEGTEYKGKEWKKIWWGNRRRAIALTGNAATLAFVYRLSGEKKYGLAAKDLIMAFAEWDPAGATNYRYNDEAAMPLLYYPARAYTWAYDLFSEDDRAKLASVMRQRGRDCFVHLHGRKHLWRPYSSHSNRAWHWLGEVAITFQDAFPEAEEWLDYALTIFYTCYPVWGREDGGWHEGAAYWASYLGRFMYWVHVSRAALGIDPFEKPFFSATGYYGMYLLPPGTATGGFGDQTRGFASSRIAPLMAQFAAGAKNPHWQWYADAHNAKLSGWFGFLNNVRTLNLEAEAPSNLPASRLFPGAGLAFLNTDLLDGTENIQVQFKASPYGRQSHGYNANNAFLLNMRGKPVFIRSGRRDVYGSPHHTKWMWHSKSDNAITVNGKGQAPHSNTAAGVITAFHTSDALDITAGEVLPGLDTNPAGAGDGALWRRRIIFVKPAAILIHDWLEAPEPATYQWRLHAPGPFTIDSGDVAWKGAGGEVGIRFLAPADLALSQTDEFETPPHDWAGFDLPDCHFTAETRAKSAKQQFLTLLLLDGAEADISLLETGEENARIQLQVGGRELAVDFGTDWFRMKTADFEKEF